jgi:3'-phosphoadenosine 5'-phosphosulfate sulfotransferase (PAPS reductase)/FAD synthetase
MSDTMFTRDELREMQAWPLERKIRETKALISEWYTAYNGRVFVSFSSGKDSTLLLHLAREVHPDIPAAFVNTGVEYPENVAFAKNVPNVTWLRYNIPFAEVIRQFGYPAISKEVSKRIYYARRGSAWAIRQLNGFNSDGTPSKFNQRFKKWRVLMDAPFPIAEKCCGELKTKPLNRYERETGRAAIVGTMACESKRRESAFLKSGCNIYRRRNPTCKPLSFWLETDVLRYLKENNIPYSKIYGDIVEENGKWRTTGAQRTGCMYCLCGAHLEKQPNRFQRMALEHPEQHGYCINGLGYGAVLDYLGIPY